MLDHPDGGRRFERQSALRREGSSADNVPRRFSGGLASLWFA